jgi:hypothetical protein
MTMFNPKGRSDNCGYCAISRALYEQTNPKTLVDADELYTLTLTHLRFEEEKDGKDPISRMLLFPALLHENIPIPTSHDALSHGARSASQYFITSIAESLGLRNKVGDVELLKKFIKISSELGVGLRFQRLAENRLAQELQHVSRKPTVQAVKDFCTKELVGRSILGIDLGHMNHFLNLTIYPSGDVTAFDAQTGESSDARNLKDTLGTIKLFMRLT